MFIQFLCSRYFFCYIVNSRTEIVFQFSHQLVKKGNCAPNALLIIFSKYSFEAAEKKSIFSVLWIKIEIKLWTGTMDDDYDADGSEENIAN